MKIRPYAPSDDPVLYDICLRTGDSGRDASGLYLDPDLLGHVYVGPYLAFEPGLAFVLDDAGTPVGYVLGALDTTGFARRCEAHWWPTLRARYPDPAGVPPRQLTPDQRIAALIHHPPAAPAGVVARYPSHLHIDLLPRAQGQGYGRALLERLLTALAAAGSPGVHLGVGRRNEGAIAFYRRVGFTALVRHPAALTLGKAL